MMRKCPNCGSTIKNNDICPVCGKRIGIVEYRANDRPKIKSMPTPKKVSSQSNKNKKHLKTQNIEDKHMPYDNSKDNSSKKGSIVSSLLGILCIVGVMLIVVSGILVPDDTSNVVSQKPNLTNNVTVMGSDQVMFQVNVIYNGRWSGSMGVNEILNNYNQNGSKSVKFEDCSENDTISTSIQKNDPSDDELKVQVSKNGVLVKEESTKTPYGIVTISI